MAAVHSIAPGEASVLHPSKAFEALNDRLLDLIAHLRILQRALPKDSEEAMVLESTTNRLDEFQEDLDSWAQDQTPGLPA
jgi:hypothetical protein